MVPDGIDWGAFGRSILRPPRPRLAEALALARELAAEELARFPLVERDRLTPDLEDRVKTVRLLGEPFLAQAWERMAGRLAGDRLFDASLRAGRRSFLPFVTLRPIAYGTSRQVRPDDSPGNHSPIPRDLETMVAVLSADESALFTAEAAALEAAERMRPWGCGPVTRVGWVFAPESWPPTPEWSRFFWGPFAAATGTPSGYSGNYIDEAMGISQSERNRGRQWFATRPRRAASLIAGNDAVAWCCWRAAAREGVRVPTSLGGVAGYSRAVEGVPFSELPDPLDPLLVVWGSGFMPIDIRGDTVILGASLPSESGMLSGATPSSVRSEADRRYGRSL